jgi:hypothetical protein
MTLEEFIAQEQARAIRYEAPHGDPYTVPASLSLPVLEDLAARLARLEQGAPETGELSGPGAITEQQPTKNGPAGEAFVPGGAERR